MIEHAPSSVGSFYAVNLDIGYEKGNISATTPSLCIAHQIRVRQQYIQVERRRSSILSALLNV